MRPHSLLALSIVFFAFMMGFLGSSFGVTLLTINTVSDETASYSGLDPDVFAGGSSLALLRGCITDEILKVNASGQYACASDATASVTGAGADVFDIGDDGSNESDDFTELATTGDTNGCISEPSSDKVLIDLSCNWPTADNATTADALSANPTDCSSNQFATTIAANGNLTCAQPAFSDLSGSATDGQIPNTITVDLAATATALAADPADCGANTKADAIAASGALTCSAVDTGDITDGTILEADLKAVDTAADEECLTYESTGGDFEWQSCGSGGVSITLDLGDDGGDDSTALAEIATDNDTNDVFTMPASDKLYIDLGQNWPSADTADALSANPDDCSAGQYAVSIVASGNLTCAQVAFSQLSGAAVDSQIPDTITIDLAATATALASNPSDCSANQFANAIAANGNLTCAAIADADVPDGITIDLSSTATALAANGANCSAGSAPLGVDASGAAESCTDYVDVAGDTMTGALTVSTATLTVTGSGSSLVLGLLDCTGNSNGGALTANGSGAVVCSDDDSGAGATGTVNTIKESGSQVGGADIVTIDFGACFDVGETPDTEVNITWDASECGLTDDAIWQGSSGGLAAATAIPDCDDSGGNHLNYDTTGNTWDCGTSSSVTDTNTNAATECAGTTTYLDGEGNCDTLDGLEDFATATDDSIPVGNGATFDIKAIADCDDSGGNHLNYDTTGNTFSCGTSSSVTDTNTNASTECAGTTTYYDGEGNCDTLDGVEDFETATDDGLLVGNGSAFDTKVLPDCGASNQSLAFTGSGNTFACNTFYYERALSFPYSATLAVTASGGNTGFEVPVLGTSVIKDVYCRVSTAPTGANIIVDINLNGATIFTNQSNRPTITAGSQTGLSGAPSVVNLAYGDYLDFDIDQIGSTVEGENLMCLVRIREPIYNFE